MRNPFSLPSVTSGLSSGSNKSSPQDTTPLLSLRNFVLPVERPSSTPITPTFDAFQSRPVSPSKPPVPLKPSGLSINATPSSSKPPLPISSTAFPKDLFGYLRNYKVLLIDVRNRADFEREHIKADAIVCMEPQVLMRSNVTADMLEDSMVLAPKETPLFNNREKFELVVLYDQNSTSFGQQDSPLSILVRTIFTQAFKKMLKKGPMILVGGIDAWKKDVGEAEVVKGEPSSLSYVAPKPITPSTSMNDFGIAEPEIHASNCILQNVVDCVLRAVQKPAPNGIVEVRNATPAVYDTLTQALDEATEIKRTSLHYDAASSKILVYGPPSHVHDNTAYAMIRLAQAASQEICRIYDAPNKPHFTCCGRVIELVGRERLERPASSFSICKQDQAVGCRHCVVIEVAYSRSYAITLNALRTLLHFSEGEVRLGFLIKIQPPGKGHWKKNTEWKEEKNWHVWIQIFTTPKIYEQCHSDQTPSPWFEDVEVIAGDTPLPPDVVIDASQQSEPVAPPSPQSTTASENSISEDYQPIPEEYQLVPLGSYQVHPFASDHASSIPICLGMVLTEQIANSLGVPWDTVKTHWFNWNTTRFQADIKSAIKSAIINQIPKYIKNFEQGSEKQGGKRKRVDLDSPANKRPHLDSELITSSSKI